jgi:hypothetical protein
LDYSLTTIRVLNVPVPLVSRIPGRRPIRNRLPAKPWNRTKPAATKQRPIRRIRLVVIWCKPILQRRGIDISFQPDLGFTTNSRNPANPAGGTGNQPATLFNYLNDQFMVNQFLITLDLAPKSGHGEFGFGWRVDLA